MKLNNITIGADPELFFEDIDTGKIVTVEGKISGSKENPTAIDEQGHFIQQDNIMAEFNIPPTYEISKFKSSIAFVLSYLDMIAGLNNCKLNFESAHVVDGDQLMTEKSLEFGCEPDMNAYTGTENVSPNPDLVNNLRCAGGHIHIGYDNPTDETSINIVKLFDIFIGVASIKFDRDGRRRTMYGKAGSYRLKSYGVEYRTLSNFWIKNAVIRGVIFAAVKRTLEFYNNNEEAAISLIAKYAQEAKDIIDNNKLEESRVFSQKVWKACSPYQKTLDLGVILGTKKEVA